MLQTCSLCHSSEMSVYTVSLIRYKIKNHWKIPFTVHAPQYAHPIAPYDSYYNYTMYTRTVDCTYTRATFYWVPPRGGGLQDR